MRQIAVRLKPGMDLRKELENFASKNKVKAGTLASIVGGLSKATLTKPRKPGEKPKLILKKDLEIVSGMGTFSPNDLHVHISVSDGDGKVWGGHLYYDTIVRITTEVVILVFDNMTFKRELDKETGFEELKIKYHK
ncbi:hypothetical protein A2115_02675 [Candidatus Woesebacteria bacterium GWA1_41_8]|uniref:PPC domain-containing protein n=1 Tax=Candidatus Woesebacteria bacterium GWA1_41_8 TaxID=1802471 RepID=A0A1F7WHZ3_9BACT|nr:MAG: hypothetical protein A2115_02675 [Candidatus Woesebacteria bacterium GWA1_41_8]